MRRITVGNFEFDVEIERKNIKYCYVKVEGRKIKVKAPVGVSENKIIKKVLEKIRRLKLDEVEKSLLNDFLFFGKPYKIIKGKSFSVNHRKRIIFLNQKCRDRLVRYLEVSLERYAENYVKKIYKKFGLNFIPEIKVDSIGSDKLGCVKNGKVYLNFCLSFFPKYLIRYIITHELLHFKISSHNSIFRHLISLIYPNYRKIEKEVKKFLIITQYNKNLNQFK